MYLIFLLSVVSQNWPKFSLKSLDVNVAKTFFPQKNKQKKERLKERKIKKGSREHTRMLMFCIAIKLLSKCSLSQIEKENLCQSTNSDV